MSENKDFISDDERQEQNINSDLSSIVSIKGYINESRPWFKVPHLLYLNFCIFLLTLSSTTGGYDMSMMNGLQALDSWNEYFGTPTGQRLGALSNGKFPFLYLIE